MVKLSDRFNSTGNGVTLTSVVPMESGPDNTLPPAYNDISEVTWSDNGPSPEACGEKGGFGGGWRNRMIDSLDGNPDKMGLSRFGSNF